MANLETVTRLFTDKSALGTTDINAREEDLALEPGEILVSIDRFGLSSNNITYAALGDWLKYWKFFPTGQEGWGHMPVWGFADVVASTVDGVAPGERFYGYFPIASHFRLRPDRVSARGFYDGMPHRQELVSAYNFYMRCSADVGYSPDMEDYQMLFRPLFITSFMLADFLTDNSYFGAKRLLISSASSKTAYGTAYCLEGQDDVEVVALTSARNADFVESLGCYDKVVSYDALEALDKSVPTTYVDFSGDNDLRLRVHKYFGGGLVYDCFAGTAAHAETFDPGEVPGPEPLFFFAPVQIKKRNKDWTPQGVTEKYGAAEQAFYKRVSEGDSPWMELAKYKGMEGAQDVITTLFNTGGDPRHGMVVRL
ncbi:DUF2855 family protein [Kordiimonas aestuarii]|uniref:DUF2855 family protein n=1 Tax=Kordiimonas aestuarii TaxID=1005925 RepID=UPI0021D0D9DB|nr:DUF2855 family protein [Kordiimonas aestuarii]